MKYLDEYWPAVVIVVLIAILVLGTLWANSRYPITVCYDGIAYVKFPHSALIKLDPQTMQPQRCNE